VELDKNVEFIGRDALKRIKTAGVKRKVVGIEIHADPLDLNETAWPVSNEVVRIGKVTSAVYSPRLKRNIAYAMVPVAHAEIGMELLVGTPLGPAKATVVRMPFVDPRKEIPRG
jgi:aminomethyltransferase